MTSEQIKKKIEQVLGNDIRCLLPSYWWKNLFHSVVDKIDEVDKKVDEIDTSGGITIVNSKSELDNLNLRKGSVATVMNEGSKFSDCYLLTDGDNGLEAIKRCTRVKSIGVRENHGLLDGEEGMALLYSTDLNYGAAVIFYYGGGLFQKSAVVYNDSTDDTQNYFLPSDAFNKFLAEHDMRFISYDSPSLSSLDKAFVINADADVYVKGDAWERLQDEGDAGDIQDAVFVVGFNEKGEPLCTDEQKEANILSFNKYTSNMDIRCVLKYYYQFNDGTVAYPAQVHPEAVGHSYLMGEFSSSVIFKGVNLGDAPFREIPLIGKYDINFFQTGDVSVLPSLNMGQVNLLYITLDSFKNLDLTDWNKRHNKAIYDSWASRYDTPVPAMAWVNIQPSLALYPAIISGVIENNTLKTLYVQVNISNYMSKIYTINSDGSLEEFYEDRVFDSEMSDTSTKGVQNKVIKKYVDDKVSELNARTMRLVNFGTSGCKTFDELHSKLTSLNLPTDETSPILRIVGAIGERFFNGQVIYAYYIGDSHITLDSDIFRIQAYKSTQTITFQTQTPSQAIYIKGNGSPLSAGRLSLNRTVLNVPEGQFANFYVKYLIGDDSIGDYIKLEPISVQRFPSTLEADWATHYDFVVYVNDVFEKWRINIDGSVVKLS